MIQTPDLDRLHQASTILHTRLPRPDFSELPEEIARALETAQSQMGLIPEAIRDLQAARRTYDLLDRTIDRLLELARRSADLPADNTRDRERLEEEFVQSARIVAQAAGRLNYQGPRLSVRTKPLAKAAQTALGHLRPVKDALGEQLQEQESLILTAVSETLNLIEAASLAYPGADSLSETKDLLRRVGWVREAFEPVHEVSRAATTELH